ncbi:MAG: redoxin domain-containing protein [Desulfobulbaceae bacterium]|nr:redoxin domain-containing protein [Desulfobulbaceae bacterium]
MERHVRPSRLRYEVQTVFVFLCVLFLLSACGKDDSVEKLKIGDRAPDFAVTDMNGERLSLKKWAGTPVILRFWSTDCKYCRADTPVFNRYYETYKQRGLQVVYLNTGASSAEVAEFVKELEIPFPVVLDEGGKIAEKYRVKIVPQTIVIDPDQKIKAAILGGVGKAELDELVGNYFH